MALLDHMHTRHDGILEPRLSAASPYVRIARGCLEILRPSILTKGPRRKIGPTSYLDGLRGFAAFLVYWQHHQVWARVAISANHIFENGYGYDNQFYFACLPGIRTFFTGGHFAVTVFFVISGYVLSSKPLALIHAGNFTALEDNIASAFFRRWLRLFIPVIATTFLYMTLWHAFGIWTAYPDHKSTYLEEIWSWYIEFKDFSFVFRGPGGAPWFTYNFHMWSIPVEFKGSIAIYTSLLAFSRCRRNARLLCEVGLIVYFLYIVDGWFCAMFMAGQLICDLDTLTRNDDLPQFFHKIGPYTRRTFFYAIFVISMYISGVPAFSSDLEDVLRKAPGWYYLSFLKPEAVLDFKWFYLFWASAFMVATIPHIHWLKSFFETRFNQYLGHISFSLYLVHGPVLWTLSDRLYNAVGWTRDFKNDGLHGWENLYPLSKAGPLGLEPSFLVPHLIILPFTLWMAEIVTKLFDQPSVRFSQWAYRKALGVGKI